MPCAGPRVDENESVLDDGPPEETHTQTMAGISDIDIVVEREKLGIGMATHIPDPDFIAHRNSV